MVGFGSSLRMGRRTGWEAAYLDYENLKLLLSQAASVYEQHGAERSSSFPEYGRHLGLLDTIVGGPNDQEFNGDYTSGGDREAKRDFRDELFLESDSDKAFASSVNLQDEYGDDYSSWDSGDQNEDTQIMDPFVISDSLQQSLGHRQLQPSQFPFSYSTQGGLFPSSNQGDSDESEAECDDTCGNVVYNPWRSGTAASSASKNGKGKKRVPRGSKTSELHKDHKKSRRRQRKQQLQLHHQQQLLYEENYYPSSKSVAFFERNQNALPDTFIVEDVESFDDIGHNTADGKGDNLYSGGYTSLSSSFAPSERKSLLPPSTTKKTSIRSRDILGSPTFGSSSLEPARISTDLANATAFQDGRSNYGSVWNNLGSSIVNETPEKSGTIPRPNKERTKGEKKTKRDRERKRAWRQRQKRRQARYRKEQEKKVPRHIRVAHSKARSITERFLGLLRAEVEKVTLFAQARLGELAETAGSLRFLSSEELTDLARDKKAAFDYPFSDGGIHPSASSSSDDGMDGGFSWSDSSSDEDNIGAKEKPAQNFAFGEKDFTFSVGSTKGGSSFALSPGNRDSRTPLSETKEKLEAMRRKIAHYQDIRRERPIFQRNDCIVGEDLLLVSAVDEADAFTSVAVELLHILKFICLNAIAVRKICKKHDRLSMNRMLGGYYHRTRLVEREEEVTLGGLISNGAGDLFEAHPSHMALSNHGKLTGFLDLKIQQLANSRTVKAVSSCLTLALAEYEVSQCRADALAKVNHSMDGHSSSVTPSTFAWNFPFLPITSGRNDVVEAGGEQPSRSLNPDSDDELDQGPPSTTSSVSLARLQYSVLSIAALREASRFKKDYFSSYVGRAHVCFPGQAIPGEGLDGSSRESLDLILSFSPDSALLLSPASIHAGLQEGRWNKGSLASAMRCSLAVAMTLPAKDENNGPVEISMKELREKEKRIWTTFGILPRSERNFAESSLGCASIPLTFFDDTSRYIEFPSALLQGNRWCWFLYNANYFIAHPTAVSSALLAHSKPALSAMLIGLPALGAVLVAVFHCRFVMGESEGRTSSHGRLSRFNRFLLYSSTTAVAGNVVQAYGGWNLSLPTMLLGRFVVGFAAVDILHRQFVMMLLPSSLIVTEGCILAQLQVTGQLLGIFVGSLSDYFGSDPSTANLIMAVLWTMFTIFLLFTFLQVIRFEATTNEANSEDKEGIILPNEDSSSSVASVQETDPGRLFQRQNEVRIDSIDGDGMESFLYRAEEHEIQNGAKPDVLVKRHHVRSKSFAKRIRKLLSFNVAVPLTLIMVVFTTFAQEVLFSSCTLITNRYFSWKGNMSGFFLFFSTLLLPPLDCFCERIVRRYEERTIFQRGTMLLMFGLFVMTNWGSLFALIPKIREWFHEDKVERRHQYDWLLGVDQYVVGFILSFGSFHALEIASRSLLSKVIPTSAGRPRNNDLVFVIVTFLRLFSQFAGDCQITMVVLSHRVINTDIVNALVIPMLIGATVILYFVRKHFFFLM
ncbi:SPX domain containing protein [Nitzschia inconspicua]|uniref:SPX domain containing protein n=1 Tax=Nitzschia inconspicua TaxID=303405 RepID=A0A9K3L506_9STRA|nr:SPX domain containing protein [Nitzschia inconspicua]